MPLAAAIFAAAVNAGASAQAADTAVVAVTGPVWSDPVRLVEEVRIGELDGEEAYTFGRVELVAMRFDGGVYVYDSQVPVIRHYDRSGRHVRNIGRRGGGPGEYQRVLGMMENRDRHLLIWDITNARVTFYDTAGRYVRSHQVNGGVADPNNFMIDSAGNSYVKIMRITQGGRRPAGQWPRAFLRYSAAGRLIDTVPVPVFDDPDTPLLLDRPEGERVPFQEFHFVSVTRSGEVLRAENRAYVIELSDKTHITRLVRNVAPVAVASAERAQWEDWTRWLQQEERKRGITHTFPEIPARKPYFRGVMVDDENRLWVDRYVAAVHDARTTPTSSGGRPPYDWVEPPTYDLIDSRGRLLTTLVLTEPFRPLVARGRTVWGVRRGELGEQYVVRYRIEDG